MNLSAPTQLVYLIALVVAILGLLAATGTLVILPIAAFWIMFIAYAILAIACLVKGA